MKRGCCFALKTKGKRDESFYSAVSGVTTDEEVCDENNRRSTFYGTRDRIPTCIDILRYPSDEWWSDARLDAPHVAEDLHANNEGSSHRSRGEIIPRIRCVFLRQ